ncbi:unnamed protein product [Thlaspi arvense]|uniref:Uncharacterized protein n=1 Tax=Thlaspi arvense TaxID=13288 RepID=A0AAU9RQ69_THLAR|nr:unnamed protein product [Thlaspi arvense]
MENFMLSSEGGGAGLLSKHRKAHNNIPVTYATNFGIVAGCYCDEVSVIFRFSGARELIWKSHMWIVQLCPCCILVDKMELNELIKFNHHTQVSTAVRKIIQSCFKGPWYSWKRVPVFYKQTWFSLFKKKFNWHPNINNQVESEFNKLAAYPLRGMISHLSLSLIIVNIRSLLIYAAGSSKQGYVFGLGALKEFVVPSAIASSSQPQPEEAEMIANRLQELEAEVKQNHEENLEIKKRLEAMEKMAESFANQNA